MEMGEYSMKVTFKHTSGRTLTANVAGNDPTVAVTEARNWLNAQLAAEGEPITGWHVVGAVRSMETAVNAKATNKETRG